MMEASANADFEQNYQSHLKHLKLKGLQPKTIDAYSRAIRRVGVRFDKQIDNLSEAQLTDYFTELVSSGFGATTGGNAAAWADAKKQVAAFFALHLRQRP